MSSKSLPQDGAVLEGRDRERFVESLFDRIAAPYDRLNRVISLGRDRAWRRRAVDVSGAVRGSRVCDLGTGTGDFALEFARTVGPEGCIVGTDVSAGMLGRAMVKREALGLRSLHLLRANACSTGLPDAWADAVSMGWVLRNVADRAPVYREILRILRPGGRFVSIDMSRPRGTLARAGFWVYRHLLMPVLVRLSGGDARAYGYLASSTDRFPDGVALDEELREAGFSEVSHAALMTGAIAIHVGIRGP